MRLILLALVALPFLFAFVEAAEKESRDLSFRIASEFDRSAQISDICCDPQVIWQDRSAVSSYRTRYGSAPVWLKIEGISNGGLLQFSPILDSVTLFTRTAPGAEWQASVTGDMVENARKPFETPFMALPLPEEFDRENVFARIDMPMAVTIRAQQWELPAFISMQGRDRTLKTFLIGFVTAIVLYNVVVSGLVRDPVFLINALCILSLLIFALYLSGYGAVYFWGAWPEGSNQIFVVTVLAAISLGGAFVFLFLQGSPSGPNQLAVILAPPGFAVLILLIAFVVGLPQWAIQAAAVAYGAVFCAFLAGLIGLRALRGDRRAQLLAMPFLVAVAPGVTLVLLNKIAGFSGLGFGNNTMEVTLAIEAILFSLALASRIRVTEEASRVAAFDLLTVRERSSSMALAAQDNERKRLSKELHDGVGHELLLVVSNLKHLARRARDLEGGLALERAAQDASSVMGALRRISHDMHPSAVEHLGLEGAIDDITQRLTKSGPIVFSCVLDMDDVVIAPSAQLQIVRIVQECLANVLKHSSAVKCVTTIRRSGDMLELRIEDDGVGLPDFDTAGSPNFSLGMHSIDERVRNLKGEWRREPNQNGGLTIVVVARIDALAS